MNKENIVFGLCVLIVIVIIFALPYCVMYVGWFWEGAGKINCAHHGGLYVATTTFDGVQYVCTL